SSMVVGAGGGGMFGGLVGETEDKGTDQYYAFAEALSAMVPTYLDKVESDRLVYGAVRGMLSTLDPHSSFYDPREYARMRERQEGHYYGIGIEISSFESDGIAQKIFEGSPSAKADLRQGDGAARIGADEP